MQLRLPATRKQQPEDKGYFHGEMLTESYKALTINTTNRNVKQMPSLKKALPQDYY